MKNTIKLDVETTEFLLHLLQDRYFIELDYYRRRRHYIDVTDYRKEERLRKIKSIIIELAEVLNVPVHEEEEAF